MKSVVKLEINAPQARVAELLADPRNNPRWMSDLERIDPLSGEPGQPGSKYRMVPRDGNRIFVATVVSRELPSRLRLFLDSPLASVSIDVSFMPRSDATSTLLSEEVFHFKGLFGPILGIMASKAIHKAHREHMDSFKRFAESRT